MKQTTSFKTPEVTEFTQKFIETWLIQKKYLPVDYLTLGQVIELDVATSFTFYQEDSDGRFFNYSLQNEESVISWDGEELIDILFHQCCLNIRHRLSISRTFNTEQ